MAKKKTYPREIEFKLLLVEGQKERLFQHHYGEIRREIRRNPSITMDEVKALIEAGAHAYDEYQWRNFSGPSLPAEVTRTSTPGSAFDEAPVFDGRDWTPKKRKRVIKLLPAFGRFSQSS